MIHPVVKKVATWLWTPKEKPEPKTEHVVIGPLGNSNLPELEASNCKLYKVWPDGKLRRVHSFDE